VKLIIGNNALKSEQTETSEHSLTCEVFIEITHSTCDGWSVQAITLTLTQSTDHEAQTGAKQSLLQSLRNATQFTDND